MLKTFPKEHDVLEDFLYFRNPICKMWGGLSSKHSKFRLSYPRHRSLWKTMEQNISVDPWFVTSSRLKIFRKKHVLVILK